MKPLQIKIAVFTTSRAEFGTLAPLLREIEKTEGISYLLFAGGAHLAAEFGKTINHIISSGFKVDACFDYLLNNDDAVTLTRSLSIAGFELAHIFEEYQFDYVCILGDRYELLSILAAAILFRKPIIHISGGDTTTGTIDEQIRHMATKAAHLHFTYCEECVNNIIRMGEEPWRVHNIGALGLDNIASLKFIKKSVLFKELNLDISSPVGVISFHPAAYDFGLSPKKQVERIIKALTCFDGQIVITGANSETGRDEITSYFQNLVSLNTKYHYFDSLGELKFYSLLKYSRFLIGNSSFGVIYAPYFRIPTINIGKRQNGRIRHGSVIDTGFSTENIKKAIQKALSRSFRIEIARMPYKFGSGDSSKAIVREILNTTKSENILIKKMNYV